MLCPALLILVGIEFALHAVGFAVENIDQTPEQILQVGFQPRVAEHAAQHIEHVGQGAPKVVAIGQGAGVGFVLVGTPALHLQFGKNAGGRGSLMLGFELIRAPGLVDCRHSGKFLLFLDAKQRLAASGAA